MEKDYDKFSTTMETQYPEMFNKNYGGFDVGPGWWPIIQALCANIHHYVEWNNKRRNTLLENNPYNNTVPEEIAPITVSQIKEKFGGLRFYYDGGDSKIDGMVRMAESWAANTCETCGKPGKIRKGGWLKTLCDQHAKDRI